MARLYWSPVQRPTDAHDAEFEPQASHVGGPMLSFRGAVLVSCFVLSIAIWTAVTVYIIRI